MRKELGRAVDKKRATTTIPRDVRNRTIATLLLPSAGIALSVACGSSYGPSIGSEPDAAPTATIPSGDANSGGPDTGVDAGEPKPPECAAQRVVHLIGGMGGAAWNTQLWPVPAVITGFQPTYSYDDPTNTMSLGSAAHPLYVRKVGVQPLWAGTGLNPQPTVMVAGNNQTHIRTPMTTRLTGLSAEGPNIIAAGAMAQAPLAAPLPVVIFGTVSVIASAYGWLPAGRPEPVLVANVDEFVNALKAKTTVSAAAEAELRDLAKLPTWVPNDAPAAVQELGARLLLTATALRRGYVGTVIMESFTDDPHDAWSTPDVATLRANQYGRLLQSFYADLATANEARCVYKDKPLSVADNTLLLASGDTYKAPFNKAGWADGTPGNSNLIYVRSNGFLIPGWFGQVIPNAKASFDPATGNLEAGNLGDKGGLLSVLYAIARGNSRVTDALDPTTNFKGLLSATPP